MQLIMSRRHFIVSLPFQSFYAVKHGMNHADDEDE